VLVADARGHEHRASQQQRAVSSHPRRARPCARPRKARPSAFSPSTSPTAPRRARPQRRAIGAEQHLHVGRKPQAPGWTKQALTPSASTEGISPTGVQITATPCAQRLRGSRAEDLVIGRQHQQVAAPSWPRRRLAEKFHRPELLEVLGRNGRPCTNGSSRCRRFFLRISRASISGISAWPPSRPAPSRTGVGAGPVNRPRPTASR